VHTSVDDRAILPVSDTIVAFTAAMPPFIFLNIDQRSGATDSGYTLLTASAAAAVIGIPLLFRRRYPFAVLGLMLLAAVIVTGASSSDEEFPVPFLIGASIALFTLATVRPRQTAIVTGLVVAVVTYLVEMEYKPAPRSRAIPWRGYPGTGVLDRVRGRCG
jgi:Na+/H+ antiporter NhaA